MGVVALPPPRAIALWLLGATTKIIIHVMITLIAGMIRIVIDVRDLSVVRVPARVPGLIVPLVAVAPPLLTTLEARIPRLAGMQWTGSERVIDRMHERET